MLWKVENMCVRAHLAWQGSSASVISEALSSCEEAHVVNDDVRFLKQLSTGNEKQMLQKLLRLNTFLGRPQVTAV